MPKRFMQQRVVDLSLSALTQLGKLLPYGNDQSSPQGLENESFTLTAFHPSHRFYCY